MNKVEEIDLKFSASIRNAVSEQEEFKELLNEVVESNAVIHENPLRTKVLCEFYYTEVTYLLQLEVLIKYFITPLKSNAAVPVSYLNLLFGNIFQLYQVNRELLDAVKNKPFLLCQSFCAFAPYLKLYSIYAFGYKKALQVFEELELKNKKLSEFLRSQETRPEVGASLISLLIAPVQRVPRYRLLLQSLLDSTSETHPHFTSTRDALLKAEETAVHINKLMTEAEDGEAMVRLARRLGTRGETLVIPARKILKQGVLMKASKNGAQRQVRFMVLFTDSLLCCKGGEKGPLTMSRLLPLRHLHVEPALGPGLIKVTRGEDCLLLYTSDPTLGQQWLTAIQNAAQQHAACQRTLRKESSKKALRVGTSKQSLISKLIRLKRLRPCRRPITK